MTNTNTSTSSTIVVGPRIVKVSGSSRGGLHLRYRATTANAAGIADGDIVEVTGHRTSDGRLHHGVVGRVSNSHARGRNFYFFLNPVA